MSTCIVCILSIFGKKGLKRSKMLLSAESIRPVARERALDGCTFSTLPSSQFRALVPISDPKWNLRAIAAKKRKYCLWVII